MQVAKYSREQPNAFVKFKKFKKHLIYLVVNWSFIAAFNTMSMPAINQYSTDIFYTTRAAITV